MVRQHICQAALLTLAVAVTAPAAGADIGQIKVAQGAVTVEREGRALAGQVGLLLEAADVIRTGGDGSAGITLRDNARLAVGPNSILALGPFDFDATTSQGRFDARLQRGTLAVVSGRIAKHNPQAMTLRTPAAVLAVRGTEFLVAADD